MTKKRKRNRRFRGQNIVDEYYDEREHRYQERNRKRDRKRFKGVSYSPELTRRVISEKRLKVRIIVKKETENS